jgi:S-adenosylmethionine decarboxylase
MLHIAAKHGFPFHNANSADDIQAAATPYRVFYSRKNFLFPEKQQGPHRSWKQEVKYLDDMFDGGSAYMVGKMNGDHWYLYLTSPNQQALTPPRTPGEVEGTKIPVGTSFNGLPSSYHDETLEILMTDLDPENAKQFYLSHASAVASDKMAAEAKDARKEAINSLGGLAETVDEVDVFANDDDDTMLDSIEALTTEGHALGTVVSESCGLSSVYPTSKYPDARVDAYLFSPCGFSANGVVPPEAGKGEHYFTVHVTPEPQCSFASFETNVPGGQSGRTTTEIIEHVVDIFKPGRFSVTLFEAKGAAQNPYCMGDDDSNNWAAKRLVDPVRGYRRIDRIVHDFEDYDLVFRFYEREGWAGTKSARVGEPVSPTK